MRLRLAQGLVVLLGLGMGLAAPAQTAKESRTPTQASDSEVKTAKFSDADAARVLDRFRQALESYNQRGLLKLFDAGKMPDYPAFRDQVQQFFDKYEAFQVQYRITQVSDEEHVGVALADFQVEATPNEEASPNVRRQVQLRLVLAWEEKKWKIVDLAPRGLFN
ncbi:MAG: nuclear transport factor 2 family protein [Acidobacteriia bacterium]|nr:nuclear transport factor 2 family protein [Terriglobia bacterium]